jgi:hypothetical protein
MHEEMWAGVELKAQMQSFICNEWSNRSICRSQLHYMSL